jgi:hypothetical protein
MKQVKKMKVPTKAQIATTFKMVRGMLESVELDWPEKTSRDRILKHKTLKALIGTMLHPKTLIGATMGAKRGLETDLAVIADIKKFGSLPKAIEAHLADGRLPRTTTKRSHIERIRARSKST